MSPSEARPEVAAQTIPTGEELVARARALAPKLRERAIKAERDRNIPRESIENYLESGLIHTLQPKTCRLRTSAAWSSASVSIQPIPHSDQGDAIWLWPTVWR
jgi:hypothetical protein